MKTPEQFYRDLEEMLELDPGTIKGDESLDTLNWDSMAVVMFIALADKNHGVAVSAGDVRKAASVADLFAILSK
ncbi:MAG: acyl carrier protein [Verrucomicrobiota bacterium]